MKKTESRLYILAVAIALFGTTVAFLVRNRPEAVGFAVGAAFSVVNLWAWHRFVNRVGESTPAPVLFAGRYFIFAAAGYAILNYFEASLLAALAGCFTAVAAVLLEILLELFYGT